MANKVDGNPQLHSRDWSMYSNILKPNKPETRTKVDFLFLKEPTFCQKNQLVKLAQKLRKSLTF